MSESESLAPHLSVVGGNPTAEELAVVVALLTAARNAAAAELASGPTAKSTWSRNPSHLRSPLTVGHNQWLNSLKRGLN